MKKLPVIAFIFVWGLVPASAATITVKFINNVDKKLTLTTTTKAIPLPNCVKWPSEIEVPAKTSKDVDGTIDCAQYEFTTNFTLANTNQALVVQFNYGTDMGGYTATGINFPGLMNEQKINFRDAGSSNPWTFIFEPLVNE